MKCAVCEHKTTIVALPCRCGKVFCKYHRLPEQHQCAFDYKEQGRKDLGEAWKPTGFRSQRSEGGGVRG
jgi:AN1-like Zinc finger